MDLIYSPNDSLFKADTLEELKDKIVEYLTVRGVKPYVEIRDGLVFVHIDSVLLQEAEDKYNEATTLANQGKFEDAIELYFAAVRLCPQYADAYRNIAQIQMLQGDLDCALDTCIEALRWGPRDVYSLTLMGNIFMRKHDNVSAESYYRKVLEFDPGNKLAINNLCGIMLSKDDFDGAIQLGNTLLEGEDPLLNTYYAVALAYYNRKGSGDMAAAYNTILRGLLTAKDRVENPGVRNESISLMKACAEILAKTDYDFVIDTAVDIISMIDRSATIEKRPNFNQEKGARLSSKLSRGSLSFTVSYNPDVPQYQHDVMLALVECQMTLLARAAGKLKLATVSQKQCTEFRRRYGAQLAKLFKGLDRDELASRTDRFCNNFINNIVKGCIDLFAEDKMYADYRLMRPVQMLSLFKSELDYIVDIQQKTEGKTFPLPLLSAQKIMGIVRSFQLKALFAVDMANQYKPTKQEYETAKDIYDEYLAYHNCTPGEEFDFVQYVLDSLNIEQLVSLQTESEAGMTTIDEDEYKLLNDLLAAEDIEYTPEQKKSQQNFQEDHKGDDPMVNMMMAMYMLSALQYFDTWSTQEVRRTAMEIAVLGTKGISPAKKSGYKVASIPDKDFGGYQLIAYYYVSWAIAEPQALPKLGLGMFDKAYEIAKQMHDAKK